ncbi:MAG: cytochrome P450 [Myxococcota bacterium]|jgi:cytochrome P450 family 144|nr:cytochrome P450 [Myxococcota bacterium]
MIRAPSAPGRPAELLEASTIEDPHPFLRRVREAGPISRLGETGVHLIADWEGILEVLDREEDFSANLTGVLVRAQQDQVGVFELPAGEGTQVIATADEPRHAVHRRLLKPGMSSRGMAALEPMMRDWAREAIRDWLRSGAVDFAPVAEILPARVVGHLLGLPPGDVERHREWALVGGEILAGDISAEKLEKLARDTGAMAEYLAAHLEIAGRSPARDDLLSGLAAGVKAGRVTSSEATGIALVLFGAGGESTTALIGSCMRLLAADPGLCERLRKDRGLVPRFVEEVLRLEPPFKFHYRAVRRECELMGYFLEPGDRLMLLWAAANRDPELFEDPDRIRLDRKYPKHHLSFGRGAHFCLGEQVARLEVRVMLEEVLKATREFSLDPASPPVHTRSIFVRRLEKLPIQLG